VGSFPARAALRGGARATRRSGRKDSANRENPLKSTKNSKPTPTPLPPYPTPTLQPLHPPRTPPPNPTHPDPTMSTLRPGRLSSASASSEVMACSAPGMSSLVASPPGGGWRAGGWRGGVGWNPAERSRVEWGGGEGSGVVWFGVGLRVVIADQERCAVPSRTLPWPRCVWGAQPRRPNPGIPQPARPRAASAERRGRTRGHQYVLCREGARGAVGGGHLDGVWVHEAAPWGWFVGGRLGWRGCLEGRRGGLD
jgi:hypothetical protein